MLSRAKWAVRNPTEAVTKAANKVFHWASNGDSRPAFYDIDLVKPELRTLDQNCAVIRGELDALLQHKAQIPRYHEIDPRETYISGTIDPEKDWRVFMLWTPLGVPRKNQARCPQTTQLISKIPGLVDAFFSILDPGKSIPAHRTEYLGYLRYHLALRVPKNNPPTLRVRERRHTWREGESILFDDSLEHEVFNESDETRAVLIVDVMRPMNLPAHALNALLLRTAPFSEEARQVMYQIERH